MPFDDVLAHVIRAAKSDTPPYTFLALRDVLKKFYSDKMTLQDVIYVLMEMYHKAVNDPRLHISTTPDATSKLLLAPLNMAITDAMMQKPMKSVSLQTTVTLENVYDNFIHHIIVSFRLCNRSEVPELQDEYQPTTA